MNNFFDILKVKNKSSYIFKRTHDFNQRLNESKRIISKYPDRVPIICQRSGHNLPEMDKHKFLVPHELTMGQFIYVIRRRMSLKPEIGVFCSVGENHIMPNITLPISSCLLSYADDDGFLYVTYSGENTFG
jgi:GABA(A) receptor-associated protein